MIDDLVQALGEVLKHTGKEEVMGAHKKIMIARQGEEAMKAYDERFADESHPAEAREENGSWQTSWYCETCGSPEVLVAHWVEPTLRRILDPIPEDECMALYKQPRGWCNTCNAQAQVEAVNWWKKNDEEEWAGE
tara:strand:+ start:1462 stop:1866 length:405 start_codon:yes stop_codon:yes gene_type:complete